ncbi:hypothetical protein F4811DRAFT_557210 [Daldinia bambusicola]|nr:hypothetical protein F4811DRAFT_557210 [Daldinia bambusicola]
MTSPDSLQVFHRFPKLPIEVRLMIWEYNLPGPRILDIQPKFPTRPKRRIIFAAAVNPNGKRVCSAPANLQVCRESREEALKRYKPFLGIRGYMDPLRDVLYFGQELECWELFEAFVFRARPEDLACARHIAIGNEALMSDVCDYRISIVDVMIMRLNCIKRRFTNLERVSFICANFEKTNTPPVCYQHGSLHLQVFQRPEQLPGCHDPNDFGTSCTFVTQKAISIFSRPCPEHTCMGLDTSGWASTM